MMEFPEYMENLAMRHVDVRHVPGKSIHFLSSENEKHTSMDSILCYPAVIFDRGDGFRYSGTSGNFIKDKEFILVVIDHVHDTGNYAEINAAFIKCECILDEFLNQMIADKLNPDYRFLRQFQLSEVECDYVQNLDHAQYGIIAYLGVSAPYKAMNCRKAFLFDRSFDETFDKSFN